jgi:hypothetical protein
MTRWLSGLFLLATAVVSAGALTGCDDDCSPDDNCPAPVIDAKLQDSGPPADLGVACDPVAQNCATGQKCSLIASGSTLVPRCVPDGTVGEGQSCTVSPVGQRQDNCLKGLLCVTETTPSVDASTMVCAKFCGSDSECTMTATGLCDLGVANTVPQATVCEYPQTCNPFSPSCPAGQSCYLNTVKMTGYCFNTGSIATGQSCTFANDCVTGDICEGALDGGTQGTCRELCARNNDGGGPTCSGSATCMSLAFDPYGFCQ